MTISIGAKIKSIREKQGRTQEELADFMDWGSHTIVSNVEADSREIKARELAKVADFLSVPLNVFFEDKRVVEAKFFWRNKPSGSSQKESEFKLKAREFSNLEVLAGLKTQFRPLPCFEYDPENFRWEDPELAVKAANIRGQMELGKFPSNGLIQVLEDIYGVKFFTFESDSQGSAATILDNEIGPCIFLKSDEVSWRHNYSVAHELFHLLTWNSLDFERLSKDSELYEKNERAAESFAAALLIPEEVLRAEVEKIRSEKGKLLISDAVYLSLQFGVSAHSLMIRLKNLSLAKPSNIEKALSSLEFNNLVRKTNKQRVIQNDFNNRFTRLAVSCHLKGRLSKARLAKMLNIKLIDLESYLINELSYDLDEFQEDEVINS